jgi:hypothetical protein
MEPPLPIPPSQEEISWVARWGSAPFGCLLTAGIGAPSVVRGHGRLAPREGRHQPEVSEGTLWAHIPSATWNVPTASKMAVGTASRNSLITGVSHDLHRDTHAAARRRLRQAWATQPQNERQRPWR